MSVFDLVLPPACSGCGRVAAGALCPACRTTLRPPLDERDRFVAPDAGTVVGDRLVLGVAAFAYEGRLRRSLAALKYGGVRRLAPVLARLAAPRLADLLRISGPAVLAPVPVHSDRRRVRGYDQAELLARALGSLSGRPVVTCLKRVRPTTKQHRLDRVARLHNLRDAFAVRALAGRVPAQIVLVDDIVTTTATLEACASVLVEAGAVGVYGFAVAREV